MKQFLSGFDRVALLAVMLLAAFSMAVLPSALQAGAATGYFSALPELPLPPEMHEEDDSAVRFDQPEGRVIVLRASGNLPADAIIGFYDRSLPALGWEQLPDSKGRYLRDGEILLLTVRPMTAGADGKDGASQLNVLLRPR